MSDEKHDCLANVNGADETNFAGGQVYVYSTCRVCGEELEIEYEFVDYQIVE